MSTPTKERDPMSFLRHVMNYDEAADYLRISVRAFKELVDRKEIIAVPVTAQRRVVRRSDLDAYLDRVAGVTPSPTQPKKKGTKRHGPTRG